MLFALSVLAAAGRADADGPWKGQIVDAETGAPLEGVVVLAFWVKYTATPGGWAGVDFVDAEEAVTGPDGRFVISPHSTFSFLPWKRIQREVVIRKPGYGLWKFRSGDPAESNQERIIEMPRLRTREERLEFYHPHWAITGAVPPERAPRLYAAQGAERAYLGFGR